MLVQQQCSLASTRAGRPIADSLGSAASLWHTQHVLSHICRWHPSQESSLPSPSQCLNSIKVLILRPPVHLLAWWGHVDLLLQLGLQAGKRGEWGGQLGGCRLQGGQLGPSGAGDMALEPEQWGQHPVVEPLLASNQCGLWAMQAAVWQGRMSCAAQTAKATARASSNLLLRT